MSLRKLKSFVAAALVTISLGGAAAEVPYIVLQSTTSTQNSGLFDYLLPIYASYSGVEVRPVAVGTGQALKNARNGDGDVLLVHAKSEEEAFVEAGFGVKRDDLMYNDFVIVGPPTDPAGVAQSKNVVAALLTIALTKSVFVSRGDDSGTHKKEVALWGLAGIDVAEQSGTWYLETGSGMGTTLNVASGRDAYVMTDRATWISFSNKREFTILLEDDPLLFNQYGIILVNPARHPHVRASMAQAFIDWMLGLDGQALIAKFKVNGEQLFYPNASR